MLYFCSWCFFNKPWKLDTVMTEWSQDQGAQKEKDHANEQPAPSSTRHQDWDHLQGLKDECIRRPWRGHWIRWISTAQKHVHMNSIGDRTPHRWAIGRWGVGRESTQIYAFVLNSSSCVPLTIIFKVEDGRQMTMVSSGFPRKSCKRFWPQPERVFSCFSHQDMPKEEQASEPRDRGVLWLCVRVRSRKSVHWTCKVHGWYSIWSCTFAKMCWHGLSLWIREWVLITFLYGGIHHCYFAASITSRCALKSVKW